MQVNIPFLVDEHGRVNGVLYVLPHEPGFPAYGLVPGWYVWTDTPSPDIEPEGPFNYESEALACVA